jgi:histidinol dehydrogenase
VAAIATISLHRSLYHTIAMLPLIDLSTSDGGAALDAVLAQLRATASAAGEAAATVAAILADVSKRGDDAVVDYMRRWTDPHFSADRIAVTPDELDAAGRHLTGELRDAITTAIAHVTAYQTHIKPRAADPIVIGGAELGMRWTPVDSVGLCVPGGTAVLFSTLIMLAVPALVAGVPADRISVISPPPTRSPAPGTGGKASAAGDISPIVLAVCKLLGISRVYRIGGAQGVAALALGTQRVNPVDLIAGPGNVFVQLAKAQLGAVCGTDNGFYGPSEIVTIADESARPACVAADLIAQAEHNPGKCFLIAWSRQVLDAVIGQLQHQLTQRTRVAAIAQALREASCAVLVKDEEQACAVADRFAAEHVNLAVREPRKLLGQLRHGGEFFLGDATPVAAGDYYAGPSHCLPTGTTARFTSGVSVHTFLKRSGTVAYPHGMDGQTIAHIAAMAQAEGLDAHAESVRVRSS